MEGCHHLLLTQGGTFCLGVAPAPAPWLAEAVGCQEELGIGEMGVRRDGFASCYLSAELWAGLFSYFVAHPCDALLTAGKAERERERYW